MIQPIQQLSTQCLNAVGNCEFVVRKYKRLMFTSYASSLIRNFKKINKSLPLPGVILERIMCLIMCVSVCCKSCILLDPLTICAHNVQ